MSLQARLRDSAQQNLPQEDEAQTRQRGELEAPCPQLGLAWCITEDGHVRLPTHRLLFTLLSFSSFSQASFLAEKGEWSWCSELTRSPRKATGCPGMKLMLGEGPGRAAGEGRGKDG